MPSTNKTEHLGLNQWVGSDKPTREDFNKDNAKVDGELKAHDMELLRLGVQVPEGVEVWTDENFDPALKMNTQIILAKDYDLNNLTIPGIYSVGPTALNLPTNSYSAVYITRVNNDPLYAQQLVLVSSGYLFFRASSAGNWGGWKQITLTNYPNTRAITALYERQLELEEELRVLKGESE